MNHVTHEDHSREMTQPIEEDEQLEYGFLDEAMDGEFSDEAEDSEASVSIRDDDPDDLDEDEV